MRFVEWESMFPLFEFRPSGLSGSEQLRHVALPLPSVGEITGFGRRRSERVEEGPISPVSQLAGAPRRSDGPLPVAEPGIGRGGQDPGLPVVGVGFLWIDID